MKSGRERFEAIALAYWSRPRLFKFENAYCQAAQRPRCSSLPLAGRVAGRSPVGWASGKIGKRYSPCASKTPHAARSEGMDKAARVEVFWFSFPKADANRPLYRRLCVVQ